MADPVAAEALTRARERMQARDFDGALAILGAARAGVSAPEIALEMCLAHKMKGDVDAALAAADAALAADPYFFLALLTKGSLLEQRGHAKLAAATYRNALKIAPPEERMPPSLAAATRRARETVRRYGDDLAGHLRDRLATAAGALSGERRARLEECVDVLAGRKKVFVHEALLLNYPKLPAYTFYDRGYFPWLEELEAATEAIRRECEALVREDWEKFAPYIQFRAGDPVNQWAVLNHSPSWSTVHLWRDGRQDAAVCARCPETAATLSRLPMAHQEGFAPTAMFSVLAPKTHIPPHTGSSNTRLICHLPLILPGECRFRVGNDVREWKMGEAFVFDDTIEHEAWNDSDRMRVVLIFDVWNPLLDEAERAAITTMMLALKEFDEA